MPLVYFGTYTGAGSRGIYASRLDGEGRLSEPVLAASAQDPSWLVLTPDGRRLYAVNELRSYEGKASGALSAFSVDAAGALTFLNRQSSEGASPCHVVIDAAGRYALLANYHGGNVAVLPIAADGRLGPTTCVMAHDGRGPHPERQEGPHAHSIHLDPTGRFALALDLGIDKIVVYAFDGTSGRLTPRGSHAVSPAGSGPRHLCFHPRGAFAYVDNELASTVTAFAYDDGRLSALHTLPTLPAGFRGENTTAEVQCTPDGRWLYVSNRGHDSLAIFSIDGTTGRLTAAGHAPTRGRTPRHFAIDPTGTYLLAANQESDDVVVFRIDPARGRLEPTGSRVPVSRPVCVRFVSSS